jgi:hypothetical protein
MRQRQRDSSRPGRTLAAVHTYRMFSSVGAAEMPSTGSTISRCVSFTMRRGSCSMPERGVL